MKQLQKENESLKKDNEKLKEKAKESKSKSSSSSSSADKDKFVARATAVREVRARVIIFLVRLDKYKSEAKKYKEELDVRIVSHAFAHANTTDIRHSLPKRKSNVLKRRKSTWKSRLLPVWFVCLFVRGFFSLI